MPRTKLLLASTALVSALASTPALAESQSIWTGNFNNDFNVFQNWDGNFNGGDLLINGNYAVTTSTTTIATDINSPPGGPGGPRSLVISGGATLTSTLSNYAAIAIGWSADVTSTMTVTGEGSKLVVEGTNAWTNIGWEAGTIGILTVADGGTFETNYHVSVGQGAGSNGTISVDNANLNVLQSGQLIIGSFGNGTVNIANGSTATLTGHVFVGNGDNLTGNLNITGGSTATVGGQLVVGVGSNSSGDVKVSGSSNLAVSDYLVLGISDSSQDSLIIDTGSRAVSNSTTYIGYGDGSTGMLKVLNGSRFEATGNTFLGAGANSTGSLIVDNESTFIQGDLGTLAVSQKTNGVSQGSVTISDKSAAILNGAVVVGDKSTSDGLFTVSGGSKATFNSSLMLGQEGLSKGAAVFTGEDTLVNLNGAVTVGLQGVGSMQISDGATVNAARLEVGVNAKPASPYDWLGTGTGTIIVGGAYDAGAANEGALASGPLNVTTIAFGDGDGKLDFNISDSDTYTFAGAVTGAGDINVYNGTISLTGDDSAFTGDTTVSGGILLVNGTLGDATSTVAVGAGGTLGGSGMLGGDATVASGATLSPGASPGTLTINGNLTLASGSTTTFELNTPDVKAGATNDFVSVGGNLMLDGTLDATVGSAGYYYLFDYGGSLTGAFDSTEVSGLSGGTGTLVTALLTR